MGSGDWFLELIAEMAETGVGVINGTRRGTVFGISFFTSCSEAVALSEGVTAQCDVLDTSGVANSCLTCRESCSD